MRKEHKGILWVTKQFCILRVLWVSPAYAFVKSHSTAPSVCIFIVCKSNLSMVDRNTRVDSLLVCEPELEFRKGIRPPRGSSQKGESQSRTCHPHAAQGTSRRGRVPTAHIRLLHDGSRAFLTECWSAGLRAGGTLASLRPERVPLLRHTVAGFTARDLGFQS